jgi:hypothetical protein
VNPAFSDLVSDYFPVTSPHKIGQLVPIRTHTGDLPRSPDELTLTDGALFNAERFWCRFVEFRERKDADPWEWVISS